MIEDTEYPPRPGLCRLETRRLFIVGGHHPSGSGPSVAAQAILEAMRPHGHGVIYICSFAVGHTCSSFAAALSDSPNRPDLVDASSRAVACSLAAARMPREDPQLSRTDAGPLVAGDNRARKGANRSIRAGATRIAKSGLIGFKVISVPFGRGRQAPRGRLGARFVRRRRFLLRSRALAALRLARLLQSARMSRCPVVRGGGPSAAHLHRRVAMWAAASADWHVKRVGSTPRGPRCRARGWRRSRTARG